MDHPETERGGGVTILLKSLGFSTILRLKALPPYNFVLTVHKPAGWSLLTPFEIFEKETLWTVLRTHSSETFGLKLKSTGTIKSPEISCRIYSRKELGKSQKIELSRAIAWMLRLEEDIRGFYALAKRDALVRDLVKDLYGMRSTSQADVFSRLILAVTLQMAPITRSDQMMNLLIKEYGDTIRFDGKEILCWPSPERIASANVRELEQRCKLGYRAKFLKDIATALLTGFPSLQELESMPVKTAKAKLMELNGIGEYSADIVLPHLGFALDVWSAKIFSLLLLGKQVESPRDMIPRLRKTAEDRWGQWRGYAFIYVLNDLENLSRRFNLNLREL